MQVISPIGCTLNDMRLICLYIFSILQAEKELEETVVAASKDLTL